MRSVILIVHLSLDGFVAGPQGDLSYFTPGDENLAFVNNLTADADAALFGRNSYELLNGYWPEKYKDPNATPAEAAYSNWFNAAQKIVVSGKLPDENKGKLTVINGDFDTEIQKIKQMPGKSILIFGSPSLSQALIKTGLIDEVRIIMHPVFFGRGLPLFSNLPCKLPLELVKTNLLPKGHIALHYVKISNSIATPG